MPERNKIIVTGGLGYIGSHTVVQLLESNYDVIIVDDLSNSSPDVSDRIFNITGKSFVCECMSISDFYDRSQYLYDVLGIIHFAAHKSVGESVYDPIKYYENNINSLISVLRIMDRFDIQNLIFSSSCTIYGQPEKLPITEDSPILPASSPYGSTKQMCETILNDYWFSNKSRNIVSLRYFNPIGAHPSGLIGEKNENPDNLVPFLTQVAAGLRDKLKVYGNDYDTPDGTCIRDYIHVCDLSQSHIDTLNWLKNKSGHKDFFNVGVGRGVSILEIIDTFEKVTGVKLDWVFSDRRTGDIEKIWADNTKIKNIIGWSPKFSLEDSLKHAWEYQINI